MSTPALSKRAQFREELDCLIRARYPLIYIHSTEERRASAIVLESGLALGKRVFEWTCTSGLVPAGTSLDSHRQRNPATRDPLAALDLVLEQVEGGLFVFKDMHAFLTRQNTHVLRRLKDASIHLRNSHKTLVLLCPVLEVPPEIEKDLTVLQLPLPDERDLLELLEGIGRELQKHRDWQGEYHWTGQERLVRAALGLTLDEAENVFARILVRHQRLTGGEVEEVLEEKRQIIRKSGLLEYYSSEESLTTVGGLDLLKDWLGKRSAAFTEKARDFGLPWPKGILLLGVQGCGKSLCAKAVANLWQLPLLRFDMGRMFGSLMGSSEENVRRAISVAESVAPAVLWVDEIDKAFAGSQNSGASDGGTTARVFGTFLTWLSEKTAPVFVVSTANDIAHLPPELLRKGRFDEIFFVDLPEASERSSILAIHLRKRGRDPARFDLPTLVGASEAFSGAELEAAVVAGMYEAFADEAPLSSNHVLTAIQQTVPLAKTMAEQIERLRLWASGRARPASTILEPVALSQTPGDAASML